MPPPLIAELPPTARSGGSAPFTVALVEPFILISLLPLLAERIISESLSATTPSADDSCLLFFGEITAALSSATVELTFCFPRVLALVELLVWFEDSSFPSSAFEGPAVPLFFLDFFLLGSGAPGFEPPVPAGGAGRF